MHHVEVALHDRLRDILDVDPVIGKIRAYLRDNPHCILPDDGNDCLGSCSLPVLVLVIDWMCRWIQGFAGEHRREAVHPQIPDRGVVLSGFFRCPLARRRRSREGGQTAGRRSSEQAMVRANVHAP